METTPDSSPLDLDTNSFLNPEGFADTTPLSIHVEGIPAGFQPEENLPLSRDTITDMQQMLWLESQLGISLVEPDQGNNSPPSDYSPLANTSPIEYINHPSDYNSSISNNRFATINLVIFIFYSCVPKEIGVTEGKL